MVPHSNLGLELRHALLTSVFNKNSKIGEIDAYIDSILVEDDLNKEYVVSN